ncbi:MAG: hypothetical protein EOO38_03035 [Cytophagaceae bacterium]|nr:MAG: hypothetical protein EOO38_03035 [Cytophagaceae bacterium]
MDPKSGSRSPIINLAEFADESRRLLGYRQFVAGGASVFFGFVLGLGTNLWRVQRGQPADLLTPIIRAVAFTVLLIAYTRSVLGSFPRS